MSAQHTPRTGSALNWLVVNPDGKLLAVLDSESEAYFFTRNRGHANGATYFKADCDYSAAPDLLQLLTDMGQWLEAGLTRGQISRGTANRDGDLVTQIRAVLAKAKGAR